MRNLRNFFLPVAVYCKIQLYNNSAANDSYASFDSIGALFGPGLQKEGLFGLLHVANPITGCDDISKVLNTSIPNIILVKRGICQFDQKVISSQNANYNGVIVYDNILENLFPMGSESETGIVEIPSVLISYDSGEAISSAGEDVYVKLTPETIPDWLPLKFFPPFAAAVGVCLLIMLISTIVKVVKNWRKSRKGRLSRRKLNQLAIHIYKAEQHTGRFDSCAICLEDFKNNDKIRELPCRHGYHKSCIDPWLTANRKVCPLCKRTVLASSDDSEVSESEESPLLPNEVGQLNPAYDTPEISTLARALANQLSEQAATRQRTDSERSYESTGRVTDEINPAEHESSRIAEVDFRSSRVYIRGVASSVDSNDADDEVSPNNTVNNVSYNSALPQSI